jgi:cobalt-zinc-cadmium efflux system outer membrane protein
MNRLIILAMLALGSGCHGSNPLWQSRAEPTVDPFTTVAEGVEPADKHASLEIRPVVFQEELTPGESTTTQTPETVPGHLESSPGDPALTLAAVESIALANSPALAEASAQVAAARGNWLQVGLAPNVQVGYSGNEIGIEGEAGQQGGYLSQQFITSNKLGLNRQVASWQVQEAQSQWSIMRLRVLTDVRSGYYEVLIAQERQSLAEELVNIGKQGVAAADALFRAEEVSEADPLRAQVEAASAQIFLQNAQNKQSQAWRRLTAFMGTPEMEPQFLEGTLNAEIIEISWQETLAQILIESPEMAVARANIEETRWSIRRAVAQVRPNVTVQGGAAYEDVTADTIGNLQVQMAIPLWNRNQGGIRRAQANATAAQRAADRLALDITSRLANAFQRYESARNQVQQYSGDGGILARAQRSLELIRAGYQAEEFGVIDLITAQRTFFQTNLAYLDSLRELWLAAIEIEGQLLGNSLSSSRRQSQDL